MLDFLRVADLVARSDPSEILIVPPNIRPADARVVEERLRKAVSETTFGVATYGRGDAVEDLLERAHSASNHRP